MEEKQSLRGYSLKSLLAIKPLLTILIIVLLAIFIIRPGVLGYGIYRQVEKTNYSLEEYAQNILDLKLEMSTVKSNLSVYSSFASQLQEEITDSSQQLTACLGEKAAIQAELTNSKEFSVKNVKLLEQQMEEKDKEVGRLTAEKTQIVQSITAQCNSSVTKAQNELLALQLSYDALIKNSARSICCKQKVDNPQIKSYSVVENKIFCLEQGQTMLNCG